MKSWLTHHTGVLLFVGVIIIGYILSPSIGVSWDEPDNIFAGGVYWNFFLKGRDPRVLTNGRFDTSFFSGTIYPLDTNLNRYPPIPAYLGTAITALSQRFGLALNAPTIIWAFHLATAIFFGLFVATVFQFGKLFGLSYPMSLFAALVAFLYPTTFGYGFSNIKDTAQAAMFIASLYYLVRGRYTRSIKDLVIGGILWGVGLATKFNVIYVPLIWGIWLLMEKKFSAIRFMGMIALGLAIWFFVWPYLWFDPIRRGIEVVGYFTSVGERYAFFWNGELFRAGIGRSLWWYPWAYLFVSTPILLVVLGVIGAIRAIREKGGRRILPVWFIVPTLRAILPQAGLYDGLRHFVEIIPAVALFSAIGLETILRFWPKTGRVLAFVTLGYLLGINGMLFPYSSGYYNEFVKSPNSNFDRDIEGLSIKEAMDWLHARYKNFRVWAPIAGHLAWYWTQLGDAYVYSAPEADFIILVNKSSHMRRAELEANIGQTFELIHTVRRGTAQFAWIYKRR